MTQAVDPVAGDHAVRTPPGGESVRSLEAKGLAKSYRGRAVVKGVSLDVRAGEVVGLLGPNGAGKTTIFDMVWGVRYLQEARGLEYAEAVLRSSTVPMGWIIGCPVLVFVSDRLGRRKPVILAAGVVLLACLAYILYGPAGVFPPYVLGLVAGIASGAAMLPYTVIKEANPPHVSGTATGVVNFINFTFSALLGPVFGGLLLVAEVAGKSQVTDPLAYVFLGARIVQSLIHLASTSPAAVTARFTAFAVQIGVAMYWAVKLLGA